MASVPVIAPTKASAKAAAAPRPAAAASQRATRPRKSESVVDMLGLRIVSGALSPGDLLPTEAELGATLGISRPSLREGLRALALKGLVEGRTRRGTAVTPRSHWNVLDEDVLRWLAVAPPDPAFFMDLLDVRMIIEPAAARLAAARATTGQILAIEAAYRGMVAATPHDMETCCAHDLRLHELIIEATGNQLLTRFASAIRTALLACVRIASNAREDSAHSLAEHQGVAVAIRRRDPDEAEQAMRKLLAGTARDLAPAYDKYPSGFPPPPSAAPSTRGGPRRS